MVRGRCDGGWRVKLVWCEKDTTCHWTLTDSQTHSFSPTLFFVLERAPFSSFAALKGHAACQTPLSSCLHHLHTSLGFGKAQPAVGPWTNDWWRTESLPLLPVNMVAPFCYFYIQIVFKTVFNTYSYLTNCLFVFEIVSWPIYTVPPRGTNLHHIYQVPGRNPEVGGKAKKGDAQLVFAPFLWSLSWNPTNLHFIGHS